MKAHQSIIILAIALSGQFHTSLQSDQKSKHYNDEFNLHVTVEKKPTIFDQVGHLYEGVRYGLKGISSAVGAKIGYVGGGIAGIFHPHISPKRAAAYAARYVAPIAQKPFKTRPLYDYAVPYIPGRKKFPYYKEGLGYAYHKNVLSYN